MLCLNYDERGSFSFLTCECHKTLSIQTKDSEIKPCPLSLNNILKDFTINNMTNEDEKDTYLDVHVFIIILLILAIFWIFINI